ncbi:immunity 49 family protein [Uruburuella testudinis]|uniref:Immunity 49 family protein n=1 Tax=Uruburuella testudinis TaxID=1282863 RepID=A0ABY4DVY3_9NEIS|nr:Imm49 family immunity protein [Uruburuella testudinis]UOO83191.1 immunity 49 family protein [Uruburuella testudinis]
MNIMCTDKESFQHLTQTLTDINLAFNKECLDNLSYIDEKKGSPFGAMRNIYSDVYAKTSYSYLFEKNVKKFKQHAHILSKLAILKSVSYFDPEPFFFPADMINIGEPMFPMILSDSLEIKDFLIRNIDLISSDTEAFLDRYDLNRHMIYNTLLMLGGKQLARLKQRSLNVLEYPKPTKWMLKRMNDYHFYLAFAEQDIPAMQAALQPLFTPKNARAAAKETLTYFDFYLQPQIVVYAKLASMHGFDLGIDHEIAPKELINYAPLAEGDYRDIFDFMKQYNLSWPYEFLHNWIDYYTFKTNKLKFGKQT